MDQKCRKCNYNDEGDCLMYYMNCDTAIYVCETEEEEYCNICEYEIDNCVCE